MEKENFSYFHITFVDFFGFCVNCMGESGEGRVREITWTFPHLMMELISQKSSI